MECSVILGSRLALLRCLMREFLEFVSGGICDEISGKCDTMQSVTPSLSL
jgi:hypothetical protein